MKFQALTPKLHTFDSPSETNARDLCDAMGWQFNGKVTPAKPRKTRESASNRYGDRPLSPAQIKTLAILARQAFDFQSELGLTDDTGLSKSKAFDQWRHQLQLEVTGQASLRDMSNSHFRPLKAEYLKLANKPFDDPDALITGKQSNERGDTAEARQAIIKLITDELSEHQKRVNLPTGPVEEDWANTAIAKGGALSDGYMLSIARAKNRGTHLHDLGDLITLRATRLEELLFTLRNRIHAREGRGDTKNRNKNQ